MQRSPIYTILFATAVCIACAVVVSSSAVTLKEDQEVNALLEKQRNVLQTAGLMEPGESLTPEEVRTRFASIEAVAVDLRTGEEDDSIDTSTYDQRKASGDPATSQEAPTNKAQVKRIPNHALVYKLNDEAGNLEMVILPITGKGLWSTLYGFIALGPDLDTVEGITFYEHKETPGLGGEVDNPKWKAKWPGREVYGPEGEVQLEVIKGQAGPPSEDPYKVDGLSGATITSRGVTHLLHFWLGDNAFGPDIDKLSQQRRAA